MLALAELALFLLASVVFASIVFWASFLIIGFIASFSIFGLSKTINIRFKEKVSTAAFGTIILWPILLVVGGICSASGYTFLWNNSPFGWLQDILWSHLRDWYLTGPNSYTISNANMWSTFISYCVVSLLLSTFIVMAHIIRGELNHAKRMSAQAQAKAEQPRAY